MKEKFYGSNAMKAFSFLEFGSIDLVSGQKNVWDFRLHDKAYDWLMLSRYSNDMVTYMKMKEMIHGSDIADITSLYMSEMHHKDDLSINLNKLCALAIMKTRLKNHVPSFFELGQTIFGCIEGIEFCLEFLRKLKIGFPQLNLKNVAWHGVDISEFFNRLAVLMHQKYSINTITDIDAFKIHPDVFFAKGVTMLYACDNIKRLFEALNKAEFCVFDYSFSMDGEKGITLGTGKQVKYLDFDSFYKRYKKSSQKMYVRTNKSSYNNITRRLLVDCIYAEKNLCEKFIELDLRVRNELFARLSGAEKNLALIGRTKTEKLEWLTLDEFIKQI